jgi:hypothetical protein
VNPLVSTSSGQKVVPVEVEDDITETKAHLERMGAALGNLVAKPLTSIKICETKRGGEGGDGAMSTNARRKAVQEKPPAPAPTVSAPMSSAHIPGAAVGADARKRRKEARKRKKKAEEEKKRRGEEDEAGGGLIYGEGGVTSSSPLGMSPEMVQLAQTLMVENPGIVQMLAALPPEQVVLMAQVWMGVCVLCLHPLTPLLFSSCAANLGHATGTAGRAAAENEHTAAGANPCSREVGFRRR